MYGFLEEGYLAVKELARLLVWAVAFIYRCCLRTNFVSTQAPGMQPSRHTLKDTARIISPVGRRYLFSESLGTTSINVLNG
jgi:hypothetical protein